MKSELTITVPFELEKHVNEMWPPSSPGEVDSYMLTSLIKKIMSKDIPLIYSSGYFHGEIFFTRAKLNSLVMLT